MTGHRVRDTATVTVVAPVKPFFAKRRRQAAPSVPVGHVRPHARVWAKALELADGDAHRLQVNVDGSVTVLNHSRFRH